MLGDGNFNVWEYGIAVGVIILGSGLLWKLIDVLVKRFDDISEKQTRAVNEICDRHAQTLKELDEVHREERTEWREEMRVRDSRIEGMFAQLVQIVGQERNVP